MSILSKILKPNRVWSVGVYVEEAEFAIGDKLGPPRFVLNSKKLRRKHPHFHTYADPFLFSFEGELYIFFESQAVGENGSIRAYKTSDLVNFLAVGEVLKEPFHLSYPFVFSDDKAVYMVPETSANFEIALYRFDKFPGRPSKLRVMLRGAYLDSSLIRHEGMWYLFTTSPKGLEIFFTDDIEHGSLVPHPLNPITASPKFSRCGGGPIRFNGHMYRIAQDGSVDYGKNIHILRINALSKTSYEEEPFVENYFEFDHSWNSRGGHHLSFAEFAGKRIIAVDGAQNDLFANKLAAILERF